MRKILKCVLALALLSMVFTSTVLAEGSIKAGVDEVKTENGTALTIKNVDTSTPGFTHESKSVIDEIYSKNSNVVSVSSLSDNTKELLGVSSGSITPFIDITGGTDGSKVKVKLDDALMQNAKSAKAVHMKSDGKFEVIPATIENGYVVFTAPSFSPYAFVIEYASTTEAETPVYIPSKPAKKNPVVNTAAGEVNHTNYMAYAAVASVVAVGAIVVASKKLGKNVK